MKRIALVFLLTIVLPAVLLAALAFRSLRDQEVVLESQRTRLLQTRCDLLADRINGLLNGLRDFHGQLVEEWVAEEEKPATEFDVWIRSRWSQAAASVVVRDGQTLLSSESPDPRTAAFLATNGDFLTNRHVGEVYWAPGLANAAIEPTAERKAAKSWAAAPPPAASISPKPSPAAAPAPAAKVQQFKVSVPQQRGLTSLPPRATSTDSASSDREAELRTRNVMPMQRRDFAEERQEAAAPAAEEPAPSNFSALVPEVLSNEQLVASGNDGAVSRLLDDGLHLLLWKRHPSDPRLTFWTEVDLAAVRADLAEVFHEPREETGPGDTSFALLDSDGALVSQSVPDFATSWATPFVATEIGPLLPRWEVAAYLLDPGALNASAKKVRLTLWLVILALLGAVATGSALVLRSVGDEMKLATRKTDFVGNVSHELKTPLTSIRMFSELLSEEERPDPAKTRHYAEIIARESARLARLINRLLDFSKLDRGEMRLERNPLSLDALVAETVDGMREPCEAAGLSIETDLPEEQGPRVEGDRDALAQVVVNLLGNAIKYASKGGVVHVAVAQVGDRAVLSVSDRGPGVPRAHRRRIFERFYRVDDSINSGIDGSGIGLALCRQVAEQHGGTIRCEPHQGGGSVFLLELPLLT